jgi:hypothetical protein
MDALQRHLTPHLEDKKGRYFNGGQVVGEKIRKKERR